MQEKRLDVRKYIKLLAFFGCELDLTVNKYLVNLVPNVQHHSCVTRTCELVPAFYSYSISRILI